MHNCSFLSKLILCMTMLILGQGHEMLLECFTVPFVTSLRTNLEQTVVLADTL